MAIQEPKQDRTMHRSTQPSLGLPPFVVAVLSPLASLKLTVTLLACAVFVTWIATLDQASIDIWELKKKHFSNFQVYVPFQTFFVPAWFPNLQNIPFGFWIPSGFTIIVAMLVNLTAAHVLRFRIQARGLRLLSGLVVAVLAGLVTWAVIFSGAEQRGLQAQPPIAYKTMWTWMQIGLLGASVAAVGWSYLLVHRQMIEKLLLGVAGLFGLATCAFIFYLGEDGFVGDSAMRILWQLILSTFAATVGLFSCVLLFRRRAGMVLLHLGIAGLLVNEIYVTTTNTEQQMAIEEGKSKSVAVDIRTTELAIVDRSGEKDKVISIPGNRLRSVAGSDAVVQSSDLPFDIRVEQYMLNSKFEELDTIREGNFRGLARQNDCFEVPVVPGTDNKRRNYAAVKVELFQKGSNESLGRFILSQRAFFTGLVETIKLQGKEWLLILRDLEIPKPYKITLDDVQRRDYPGTDRPQWFASEFRFEDTLAGTPPTEHKIWMNNPLRYAGETFYQQSYVRAEGSRKELTVIQIVKNRGWMIPYVCCMFTVVGLAFQFGMALLSYLKKSQTVSLVPELAQDTNGFAFTFAALFRKRKGSSAKEVAARNNFQKWLGRIIFAIFLLYVLGKLSGAMRPGKDSGIRWDRFGQIPVTYDGRVKPLDSMARDVARQLCNREVVTYKSHIKKSKMFGLSEAPETKPALEWLADTAFQPKESGSDYEIIRIEDPVVRDGLKLPRRKSMDYTFFEVMDAFPLLKKQLEPILEKQENEIRLTPVESNRVKVKGKLDDVLSMQIGLSSVSLKPGLLNNLESASRLTNPNGLPLIAASTDKSEKWRLLLPLQTKKLIRKFAAEHKIEKLTSLAQKIVDVEVIGDVKKKLLLAEMQKFLLRNGKKKEDIDLIMNQNDGQLPAELYKVLLPEVESSVDKEIESRRLFADATTFRQLQRVLGEEELGDSQADEEAALAFDDRLLELFDELAVAYQADDISTFNEKVEAYLERISSTGAINYDASSIRTERFLNTFNPLYLALVLYLVASFLVIISWVGLKDACSAAAKNIVWLAFGLQVFGLILRCIISGRPPVTNLYSSFVFVSAASIPLMMGVERLTRLGIGTLLSAAGGFLALLTAWSISIRDGDTISVLQAVLDTQFWLSTHVICISLGYTATVVAGSLAIAYLLGSIFTTKFDKALSKKFNDSIYGIVCFGLLLSFFGTVLGGLWADDSWGRFWGWDPKENGALMIVLWNAVILHARWAGLVKSRGVAVLAVIGNMVTIWSWEAVNQLGIGLHAYGFTEGRMYYIGVFWLIHIGIALLGLIPTKYWGSDPSAR